MNLEVTRRAKQALSLLFREAIVDAVPILIGSSINKAIFAISFRNNAEKKEDYEQWSWKTGMVNGWNVKWTNLRTSN